MKRDFNTLFDKWRNRERHINNANDLKDGGPFVEDGAMNESKWEKADLKILFLLKEAHNATNWNQKHPHNLCERIKDKWDQKGYEMWFHLAQWAYGLRKLRQEGDVSPYPVKDNHKYTEDWVSVEKELEDSFLSCAVVNIKKSGGTSTSTKKDLLPYVIEDWEAFIWPQIQDLNPDVIVCGGTWEGLIQKHLKSKWSKEYEWVYKHNDKYFIDFWHPASRHSNKLNYYSLCTVIRMSGILSDKG